ncbi:oxygenase MpaB family protein [Spirillospora sp. NPDC029432]|uniref:oxygenase MpaB family protein n=1 Tax=Spirillospora sp. NPDC029432 TaxID=3154599 RepID=UPI003453AF98
MTGTGVDAPGGIPGAAPGAGSLIWRYAGDWRGGLGSRAILLLQVAHPVVGAGVADHSDFLEDRWGRLLRTMESTFDFLGYRGEERGRREAARLREVHKDIKGVDAQGRRYHALNPEAYLWVHATLLHGMVHTQRLFGTPIPPARERALYDEWAELALALGITERHIPEDPAAFRDYFDTMVNERLEDNATVRLLIALDREPLPPPPRWPLPRLAWTGAMAPPAAVLRRAGIGFLPPVLRERFGLPWTAADEHGFRLFSRAMRTADRALADPLRLTPIAARALWRARRERRAAPQEVPARTV